MSGRFGVGKKSRRRDEEEAEYDDDVPQIRNKIQDGYIKNFTEQAGITMIKKGIIEHKANLKPEVYFVGQIVGGFNFNAKE